MKTKVNKPWALITGASTGIGYALAVYLQRKNYNLILVSQNNKRLTKASSDLKKKYPNKNLEIINICADLSRKSEPTNIYKKVKSKKISIDILINNAGIGFAGAFANSSFDKHLNLLEINVRALVELCHLFSLDMQRLKKGCILNVASIAGFLPGPFMAMYYSSKAFVLSFSIALHKELEASGVSVSCLCPGPVKTPFHKKAGTDKRILGKLGNFIFSTSPEKVAKVAYHGLLKNKLVIFPSFLDKIITFILSFLPRKLINQISYFINKV